jgi:hypothetical protein
MSALFGLIKDFLEAVLRAGHWGTLSAGIASVHGQSGFFVIEVKYVHHIVEMLANLVDGI